MTTNDTQISEREREILRLVARGATNQQIAHELNISINTVKVHLRNIFGKIGAVSRTEATVYAIRSGLVSVGGPGVDQLPAEPEPMLEIPPPIVVEPPAQPAPAAVAQAAPPVELAPAAATAAGALAAQQPTIAPLPTAAELPTAAPRPPGTARRAPAPLWIGIGLVALLAAVGLLWRLLTPAQPAAQPVATTNVTSDESSRWVTYTPEPPLRARDGFALAAYEADGRLYAIGGSAGGQVTGWLDRYDPQTASWVPLGDKPTPVRNAGAIALRGKIYVPGGEEADGQALSTFEVYDPQERSWTPLKDLPEARSRYALTVWEGQIFLLGGWDGERLRDEIFVYDPGRNEWASAGELPSPRLNAGAAVVAGKLYLVGGEGETGALADAYRLEPGAVASGGWNPLAPLQNPIARPGTITVINSLLVFDAAAHAVWQYDAAGDRWDPYPIPADAPLAPAATLLSKSIYFVAAADTPEPGAVGEYQAIFTSFVPVRGSP